MATTYHKNTSGAAESDQIGGQAYRLETFESGMRAVLWRPTPSDFWLPVLMIWNATPIEAKCLSDYRLNDDEVRKLVRILNGSSESFPYAFAMIESGPDIGQLWLLRRGIRNEIGHWMVRAGTPFTIDEARELTRVLNYRDESNTVTPAEQRPTAAPFLRVIK